MTSVCGAAPAEVVLGEILVMAGTGLSMVKFMVFDAPPPGDGLVTITA